jgi:hypothetical protein
MKLLLKIFSQESLFKHLINAERAGTLASAIGNTGAVLNRASNGKLSSAIEQASTLPLINSSDSEFRLEGMDC